VTKETQATGLKGWIGYRPEIKVMDCTVRDGGLMNNHHFDHEFVKAVYQADIEAGVDYMEIGYKASKKLASRNEFGAWKFCDEDDMRRVLGDKKSSVKISVMADAERTDYHTDILPKGKTVVDMVRVATYIHQIPTALDMIKDAHDKGRRSTSWPSRPIPTWNSTTRWRSSANPTLGRCTSSTVSARCMGNKSRP
jgi:4-hydroxy 2-oxovalerate aldolase